MSRVKKLFLGAMLSAIILAVSVLPLTTVPAYAAETAYLYPNAAGDATILSEYPASGANWDKVDDAWNSPDDETTYVYPSGTQYDLYNLDDYSGGAAINWIKVHWRAMGNNPSMPDAIKTAINTGGTIYYGAGANLNTGDWQEGYTQYTTNPKTGVAWTDGDLDALQAGEHMTKWGGSKCTQVYIEVNYANEPVLTTSATSSETTGTLNGNVTIINDTSITSRGFVWDTASHGAPGDVAPASSGYANNWTENGSWGTGSFTHDITVVPGTKYYIRACAENDDNHWGYGNEFTLGVPLIIANAASNIASTTARLNSTISYDGGGTCQVRWGYGESSVADPEDFDDPEDGYDVITDWAGSYTTGNHPYYDAEGIGAPPAEVDYYYRMQIKNSTGAMTSTAEITFTTTSGIEDPSDLRAVPSSTNISLTWAKGSGTMESVVRYRMDTYPESYTDGLPVYQGTSSSYNFTGLTPGTTYYIAVWGKSGAYYSSGSAQVLATTTGAMPGGGALEGPVEPSGWLSAVDYTNLKNLPLVYDAVNAVADSIQMPRGNFWLILWVGVSVGIGFGFYRVARGSALAGLLALTVLLAFGSISIKLPVWMPVLTLLFCIGAFFFRKRESYG